MKNKILLTLYELLGLNLKNDDLTQAIFQTNCETYSGILLLPTCKINYKIILLAYD